MDLQLYEVLTSLLTGVSASCGLHDGGSHCGLLRWRVVEVVVVVVAVAAVLIVVVIWF